MQNSLNVPLLLAQPSASSLNKCSLESDSVLPKLVARLDGDILSVSAVDLGDICIMAPAPAPTLSADNTVTWDSVHVTGSELAPIVSAVSVIDE